MAGGKSKTSCNASPSGLGFAISMLQDETSLRLSVAEKKTDQTAKQTEGMRITNKHLTNRNNQQEISKAAFDFGIMSFLNISHVNKNDSRFPGSRTVIHPLLQHRSHESQVSLEPAISRS
jgi:hypothetical protein